MFLSCSYAQYAVLLLAHALPAVHRGRCARAARAKTDLYLPSHLGKPYPPPSTVANFLGDFFIAFLNPLTHGRFSDPYFKVL